MVGFPDETDEDFRRSAEFVRSMDFGKIHVFRYSRRKGTVADRMPNQICDSVKSERGPKGGLAILSVMSADALRFAIMAGDAKSISKAPGVGSKTAERVILDLRDKISLEDTLHGFGTENDIHGMTTGTLPGGAASDNAMKKEAIEALVALGYSASDAAAAVKKVELTEDTTVESLLKLALKHMF